MKRVTRGSLLAILVALAGCGGAGGERTAETAPQPSVAEEPASSGVPECWRDVAETYRAASTKAFPVLGDYVPDMIEQYDALIAADSGSDEAAFKRAYDRLFKTLNRTVRDAQAFLAADATAQDVLAACNGAPAAGNETAHACWNKTALAHQMAADQARVTLRRHLQRMFDAFDMIFAAAARDDDAAVAAGNRRLEAAFEAITPGARAYARKQGRAEQVYTACSGAA